jgi:hypothetical protein
MAVSVIALMIIERSSRQGDSTIARQQTWQNWQDFRRRRIRLFFAYAAANCRNQVFGHARSVC